MRAFGRIDVSFETSFAAPWAAIRQERTESARNARRSSVGYAGSASRFSIMSLKAGRAWQAASHAFIRGLGSISSGAAMA